MPAWVGGVNQRAALAGLPQIESFIPDTLHLGENLCGHYELGKQPEWNKATGKHTNSDTKTCLDI